jgi:hypothetical protein
LLLLLEFLLFLQLLPPWWLWESATGLVVCHLGRAVAPLGRGELLQDGDERACGL